MMVVFSVALDAMAHHGPLFSQGSSGGWVFGPRGSTGRPVQPCSPGRFALTRSRLPLHGGGKSVRSFIHMRDVSEGTLLATLKAEPGEIFHFSTGKNISIRSLVQLIAEKLKVSIKDHIDITEERLGKDSAYLLDSNKAKEALEWEDKTTLEEGINETIAWVRNNLDELLKQPFNYIHRP